MHLVALPVLNDNYIWILHNGEAALVVDPAVSEPVAAALQQHGLKLDAILITHHHADHVGGLDGLYQACGHAGTQEACGHAGTQVFLPAGDGLAVTQFPSVPAAAMHWCSGDDTVSVLGVEFQVMDVPGHTAGHIAYFAAAPAGQEPLLFCGDTLFSGGCGRIFEGTPAQMHDALSRLAALPPQTRVCCAHEYTLSNLRFAAAVETGNTDMQAYTRHCEALRAQGLPTVPSTIGQELAIYPFLRVCEPAVQQAARQHDTAATDPVQVFAVLREWKNRF